MKTISIIVVINIDNYSMYDFIVWNHTCYKIYKHTFRRLSNNCWNIADNKKNFHFVDQCYLFSRSFIYTLNIISIVWIYILWHIMLEDSYMQFSLRVLVSINVSVKRLLLLKDCYCWKVVSVKRLLLLKVC